MNFKNIFKKNKEIILPRLVNESWSRTLMQRLAKELDSDSEVVLNAEKVNWISPCGTILLADFAIKRLQLNKKVSIKMPDHNETKQYIISSGLLKITQSTNINDVVDANNIQLRLLHRMEPMVPEALSDFIAHPARNVNDDEKYLLRMWITELLTNANDHAKSDFGFWVCGRYNPSDHNIRICVADSGIGIKQSLVNAGKLPKNIGDAEAIEKALEEGMTSRTGKTGGLGLKHISSYVKSHGGSLTIFSGRGKAYLARKMKRIMKHDRYQGTIVSVMFDTKTISGNELHALDQTPFRFEQ
jgi:anti-sigma regulatory factor (Ser/Thr protein kinase)